MFDKHSGMMIGFMDLACTQSMKKDTPPEQLAKSMMVFYSSRTFYWAPVSLCTISMCKFVTRATF